MEMTWTLSTGAAWAWAVAAVLIATGFAGIVIPLLPGTVLIFLGMLLAAWAEGFTRISGLTIVVLAGLTVLSWVLEYVAGLLGAKAAGASPQALAGAAIGTVLGLFSGLWGLLVFPLAGAVIGEFHARGSAVGAGRVGVATWLGILAGTVAKVVIAFVMFGVFVGAVVF